MKSVKLTPSEVLLRQKIRLQAKSDALIEGLENNLEYLQHNMGALIGQTVRDAVLSKTPPILQSLLNKEENSETSVFNRWALIEGVLDILPFFIKGSKGWIVRLVLDQVKKWIFKRK
ncbi:MAG: hypothetical protein LBB85_08425 [Dysgonamonadaceae bacterium]|jgi:hypothetical protein|nr:hypothetical protein [Dysgonamonadaceae bacterium]